MFELRTGKIDSTDKKLLILQFLWISNETLHQKWRILESFRNEPNVMYLHHHLPSMIDSLDHTIDRKSGASASDYRDGMAMVILNHN